MPRRILILLTLMVAALHWLVLGGMRPGAHTPKSDPTPAFLTRMVQLPAAPPEPPPQEEPPPVDPVKEATPEAPQPAPTPKPRPKVSAKEARSDPQTAPELPADDDSATVIGPFHQDPPATATATATLTEEASTPLPEERKSRPSPDHVAAADSAEAVAPNATASSTDESAVTPPDAPASAASAPVSAASAASEPQEPSDSLSAAVEITPPGEGGVRPSKDQTPPVRMPATTTLEYEVVGEVKKFKYNVNGELAWKNNGDHYEVRQEIRAFLIGSRSQTSTGRITDAGLVPSRFGDKGKRELAAHFNFDQHEVIFSANTPTLPISAGAQDRVSVLIQLGALVAASPENYPPGTRITFTTIGPRNADRWTFTVGAPEMLDLPIGPTPAIKLEKLPTHERDLRADLWLGTDRQYLPVRLRLTQSNGDFADLRLK